MTQRTAARRRLSNGLHLPPAHRNERLAARREAVDIMSPFMWNALQKGDHVLAHVEADGGYPLREAIVVMVDARRTAHDVGVRFLVEGAPAGPIIWPDRLRVHSAPLDPSDRCWRCNS
jgi:hypothetical protein